jgi:hypothetical protein
VAYAKITRPGLKKLDDRSVKCVFIGYEQGSKAYRLYDPVANRVVVSRDVAFDEAACWDWRGEEQDNPDDPLTVEYMVHGGVPQRRAPAFAPSQEGSPAAAIPPSPAMVETAENSAAAASTEGATAKAPVKFASPPSQYSKMLDHEDDAARPHRFRVVAYLLDQAVGEPKQAECLFFFDGQTRSVRRSSMIAGARL